MGKFKFLAGLATAAFLAMSGAAQASVIFSGSGAGCANLTCSSLTGNINSASVQFSISGTTLTILLSNTSVDPASGKAKPGDGLTGLSFKVGGMTLVAKTAFTQFGIFKPGACSTGTCTTVTGADISLAVQDIDGEWGFSTAYPAAGSYGLSSAGYLPGGSAFGAPNLDNPVALNGINFAIVSPNWSAGEMNSGLGSRPHVIGTALFTLKGGGAGFTEASISDVRFWYGTAPNGGGICGAGQVNTCGGQVPEPSSMWLMLIGLLGLGAFASTRKLGV